jgi:putative hydrolase of the HAD superfamily
VGRLADLDAVTLDANGTLVGLVDPVPELMRILRDRGIERPRETLERAFERESAHYLPRTLEGRGQRSLEALYRDCAAVFLKAAAVELDAVEFAPAYIGAIAFEVLPGVREALDVLAAHGLALAVVGNWDITLPGRLTAAGLADRFQTIVTSAEAGVAKPSPAIFELALRRLGVTPRRTLHIGDGAADEEGARATGMQFEWAPLADAVERLR